MSEPPHSPAAAPDDTPARKREPTAVSGASPSAPSPQPQPQPPEGFDVARVLRVVALAACALSAFFAALGAVVTARHLVLEIPAGVVTRVEAADDGERLHLDGGRTAVLPSDIRLHTGAPIELRPGLRVAKQVGSLTYRIDDRPRGGTMWALRHWILPARVTLPLVVYFVLSWLLVFRANEHRRPIAVELIAIPLLKWLLIAAAMLLLMAAVAGCAFGCGQLLFRMGG